ncbi:MAG: carnitine dehydratase, partial [Ramlibacter sp.]|nr:carnitine dehydratase [Ramlibacter sp.]
MRSPTGPLAGIKILEMAGMGPAPFAAMLLADLGADIITVAAPAGRASEMPLAFDQDPLWRGRLRLELDLKQPSATEQVLALATHADVLLEGFRPGVMERLGLGPQAALARNPALVYGRMTGWGQEGPWSGAAGHDPNYLAITGALHCIGYPDRPPVPPLNLVGDFGGGAMFLIMGVLSALLQVRAGGAGQVVDAAIVDGALALMGPTYSMLKAGLWPGGRGENILDG